MVRFRRNKLCDPSCPARLTHERNSKRRSTQRYTSKPRCQSFGKEGFTLVETLIALAVIGIALTPIIMTQTLVFNSVSKHADAIARLWHARNFLFETRRTQRKDTDQQNVEKRFGKPQTQLEYTIKPVTKNSSLGNFSNLYREQVTYSWQKGKQKKSSQVTTFTYKLPTESPDQTKEAR